MAISWEKLGDSLVSAAPLIGGLLGSAGGVAGSKIGTQVGSLVASVLGTDATPDAILNAIQSDPEALTKIKEIEVRDNESLRNLQYKLAELDLETYRAEVNDRDSARQAHKDHWMPAMLTFVLAFMMAGTVTAMLFADVQDGTKDILFVLVGQIATAFSGAIAYWFGMTRSPTLTTGRSSGGFMSRIKVTR